jgi:hypothetical protein
VLYESTTSFKKPKKRERWNMKMRKGVYYEDVENKVVKDG